MVASRSFRGPDLARSRVTVDDDAGAVGKFELQYAGALGLAVAIRPAFFDCPRDPLQHRIGKAVEFARGHRRAKLVRTNSPSIVGIAMRRAVALILVFLALSACGNKTALYLPPPERDPQQDSKPARRP